MSQNKRQKAVEPKRGIAMSKKREVKKRQKFDQDAAEPERGIATVFLHGACNTASIGQKAAQPEKGIATFPDAYDPWCVAVSESS